MSAPEATDQPLSWRVHSGAVALGLMRLMPTVIGYSMSVGHNVSAVIGCIAMALSTVNLGISALGVIRFLKGAP